MVLVGSCFAIGATWKCLSFRLKFSEKVHRCGTYSRTAHRARQGSFAGDPDKYVADALKLAAEGRTVTQTFDLEDGRTISLISRPLASGGWVSTHMDISEQRGTERERDLLRQREERRAIMDAAIASFRAEAESMLSRRRSTRRANECRCHEIINSV